jgi:hypothetical protein
VLALKNALNRREPHQDSLPPSPALIAGAHFLILDSHVLTCFAEEKWNVTSYFSHPK